MTARKYSFSSSLPEFNPVKGKNKPKVQDPAKFAQKKATLGTCPVHGNVKVWLEDMTEDTNVYSCDQVEPEPSYPFGIRACNRVLTLRVIG